MIYLQHEAEAKEEAEDEDEDEDEDEEEEEEEAEAEAERQAIRKFQGWAWFQEFVKIQHEESSGHETAR